MKDEKADEILIDNSGFFEIENHYKNQIMAYIKQHVSELFRRALEKKSGEPDDQ